MAGFPTRRDVHYAWVVAAVAFLALVMAAGFRATAGVLIVPLHLEFGWSHETIALAVAVNLLVYAVATPFAAALIERYGMRRVVLAALATVAAGSALTILMDAPWQLYLLWGVVNGAATAVISVPLGAIVAGRWFARRRGLVTGLMAASNASGQLVFLPMLAWLAGFDWRWAAVAVAIASLGVVFPVALAWLRDHPADLGIAPYGTDVLAPRVPPRRNAFALAIDGIRGPARSGTFWLLAGTFFICGVTTTGIVATHLIPAAHDHGITQVTAAGLLALIGVFDIVGTTVSGWLTDRYDSRWLLFWYYGLRGLSLLALPFLFESAGPGLVVFAIFYGLDWVATVPPTVALAGQRFGLERVGVVFAWIFAAHQLGAAVGAEVAGAVRTALGEYDLAFFAMGALALVASVLVLRIVRTPRPLAAPA
jgi:MFS family permease